ncbi:MAG: hypothetical protein D6748_04820 [Calditrichaeota bacterium]|nr:MAG: hypothetical protein D6748_04820 [Calditrichota bacterium]
MRRLAYLFLIGLLSMFLMMSCQKDSDPLVSEGADDMEIQELASSDEDDYLFDLAIDDGSEDAIINGNTGNGFGKIETPLDSVVRFGRHINRRGIRRVVIERIAPDTVRVALSRELRGRFVIVENVLNDSSQTDTFVVHRKPLTHVVRRVALYVRRDRGNDFPTMGRRWKLYSLSMGQGNSVPYHTIQISEVQVFTSEGDTLTFSNPLHSMFNVDNIPTFAPGEEVTVRVRLKNMTTNPVDPQGNGATETVILHYAVNRHHHARKFFEFVEIDPVTDEHIYQGTWTVNQQPFRIYHAVIDAIDNGTIYDSDTDMFPYNSTTWSVPYRVAPHD